MKDPEAAGGDHGLAAAAAAVADEADPIPHVFAELNKIVVVGLLEQVQAFRDTYGAGEAVLDKRSGRRVERHADILRRGAGPADMFHFVAAIADADTAMGRGLDDLARPFIIQDMEGVLVRQDRLMDEDAPELRLALDEESLDEIFLDRDVLIIKLGQELLVDVLAQPHHREFEKPGHGRRQGVILIFPAGDVDKEGPTGERIQNFSGLGDVHFPGTSGPFRGKGFDGEKSDESGFLLAEKKPEDLIQDIGGRRSLRKFIDPLHKMSISRPCRMVGHPVIHIKNDRSDATHNEIIPLPPFKKGGFDAPYFI